MKTGLSLCACAAVMAATMAGALLASAAWAGDDEARTPPLSVAAAPAGARLQPAPQPALLPRPLPVATLLTFALMASPGAGQLPPSVNGGR